MALIKCPECGGEVSSSAQNCIHCGFRFCVCPECGTVFSADLTTCPQCGYQVKPQVTTHTVAEQKPLPSVKKIEERIDKDYATYQHKTTVEAVFAAISAILAILGIILYFVWKNKDSSDQLMTIGIYHGLIIFCLIATAISKLISEIFTYSAQKVLWEGAQWFKKEQMDAYDYFVHYKITPKDYLEKENSKYYILSRWVFFAEQPDKYSKYKNLWLIGNIFNFISEYVALIIGYFMYDYIIAYETLEISTGENILLSSPFIAIYVLLGITIVFDIMIAVIKKPINKAFEEWTNKYMVSKEEERAKNQSKTAA